MGELIIGYHMIGNLYAVLFKDAVTAYNHYNYSIRFYDLLNSNERKNTAKTFFIQDTFEAYKNSYAGCLMRLYDKTKNTLTVIDFLKILQKKPDNFFKENAGQYRGLIKEDIDNLKKHDHLIRTLKEIRNKKYFHNSIEYANNHTVIDPLTKMPYELKVEEIKCLIDVTIQIAKNYQDLFGRNIDNNLMLCDSMKDIFSLLENNCFSTCN